MALDTPHYPRLTRELARCGWSEQPLDILDGELYFQTFQGGCAAPCMRLRNEQGQRLLVIGLEQLTLARHDELFPRFLNLPLESRMALAVAPLLGEPDWLLLASRDRIELFQLPEEACHLVACTTQEVEEELMPALAALARGHEESLAPEPSHLPGAESLGGWIRHWSGQIAGTLQIEPATAQRMIWKWILMLQVARRTEGSEILGGWGLSCARQEGRWTVSYDAVSTVEDLGRALQRFEEKFSTRFFKLPVRQELEWVGQLEETTILDRLRAEMLMHTQEHFEPETVAWMFTDLAREQEGWQREMAGDITPIRQRFRHDGWSVMQPLICDVAHYGLTAPLRDTERLGRYLADLSLFTEQRRRVEPEAAVFQADLFCQNPRGIGERGELADGINYLFGEALRLRGVEPARRFGVGLTFLLKGMALAARLDWPIGAVDTLDKVFL
jgi:hypothetical protein